MADEVVYSNTPSLFTLNGQIAVHFVDGAVIEGGFATQDAYNIFVTVDGEPVMIPRSQIKFIKGTQGQSIEPDTSQNNLLESEGPSLSEDSPVSETAELFWDSEPDVNLETQPIIKRDDDDTEDGTMVLFTDEDQEDLDDEDDGTVVLYPGQELPSITTEEEEEEEDEEDGTLILQGDGLETPLPWENEEDDMTVVLGDSDELPSLEEAMDEPTVVLDEPEEFVISGSLICVSGPHAGETFSLQSGIVTMGRSSDNVIVLSNDKEISRHHAIVLQESGKFVVQDQNSLNGTFVNDEPISAPHYLEDGDIILVGLSTLRYQAE